MPQGYPFVYGDAVQAEQLLTQAVTDPAKCRTQLDRLVGGSFADWIRAAHNDDDFERAIVVKVAEWFGA